ncbi:MAG: hypothetical protein LBQ54_03180 [Planctomycetaceae bacterium]|jgi:4-amino-4-deoxy-L-arabinose transferase-like glycosyltransferase|nr:hypothetical protein [Planctomycetaceae bacterium]
MFTTLRRIIRNPLFWILLFVVIYWGVLSLKFNQPQIGGDTPLYLEISEDIRPVLCGDEDIVRTPVYPVFLALHRKLFGNEHFLEWTVRSQMLLSLIAIVVFYYLAKSLLKNNILATFTALGFAGNLFIAHGNTVIMTESLAISGIVFLAAILVSHHHKPTFLKAFLLGITVFLLIMLRPAFLILLPIFILFWACRLLFVRKTWKKEIAGLITIFAMAGLVLGYCHLIRQKSGVFNLTVIAPLNQFTRVIQSGLYQNGSDPEINRHIQSAIEEYQQQYPVYIKHHPYWLFRAPGWDGENDPIFYMSKVWEREGYGLSTKQKCDYATQTITANKLAYIKYLLKKTIVEGYFSGRLLKFCWVYGLLLVDFLTILFFLKRFSASQTICHVILSLIVAGCYFTAIAGGQAEYERLVLPVYPLTVLLFFSVIDRFTQWRFVQDPDSAKRKITIDISP